MIWMAAAYMVAGWLVVGHRAPLPGAILMGIGMWLGIWWAVTLVAG